MFTELVGIVLATSDAMPMSSLEQLMLIVMAAMLTCLFAISFVNAISSVARSFVLVLPPPPNHCELPTDANLRRRCLCVVASNSPVQMLDELLSQQCTFSRVVGICCVRRFRCEQDVGDANAYRTCGFRFHHLVPDGSLDQPCNHSRIDGIGYFSCHQCKPDADIAVVYRARLPFLVHLKCDDDVLVGNDYGAVDDRDADQFVGVFGDGDGLRKQPCNLSRIVGTICASRL